MAGFLRQEWRWKKAVHCERRGAANNDWHQFCKLRSLWFIQLYPLLMRTIFECERAVWKTLTSSIGCDWHCHSFHFAGGKWHPYRLTCIWTWLTPSLLCTLGSCDMEISSLYFMDNIFSFTMHSVRRRGSQGFLHAAIYQKNYPFSNLTQIFKVIYLTCAIAVC